MRTPIALLLLAATAAATDTVAFKLPDACGHLYTVRDFESRYLLLVYQGIP